MRLWFAATLAALLVASPARAETEVDLALVLAVDVSRSMDLDEQALQREGFVEAFRSKPVQEAIGKGMVGRIAVTYVEWSGASEQTVVVPWTVIESADAVRFADRLAAQPIARFTRTSISGAIDFSLRLLGESGVEAPRRVIDVSGDGPNSSGRMVTLARDEAVAQGVVINGLPIMLKRPTGYGDIENLDHYYRDCVIGGAGAFLVPVRERAQFAEAIRTKLVREIAGIAEPPPLVHRAQVENKADCLVGENRQRWRWGP